MGRAATQIHVACFFDRAFSRAALVMAASLARNSDEEAPTVLHAFYIGDLDFDFATEVAVLGSGSFSCNVCAIANPFQPDDLIPFGNPSYYLRLIIGDLLDLDRVIYLDVDVLVRSSLRPLYDLDLGGKTIAAAPDAVVVKTMAEPPRSQYLFLSSVVLRRYVDSLIAPSRTYFNSGVMLIDLARWRTMDVKTRCLRSLRDRIAVVFADQDILNHVLQDEVSYLDTAWNFTCFFLRDEAGLADAKILHFAGAKPFNPLDAAQPGDALYWQFAMSTPFGRGLQDYFYGSYDWQLEQLATGLRKCPIPQETTDRGKRPIKSAAKSRADKAPGCKPSIKARCRSAFQAFRDPCLL